MHSRLFSTVLAAVLIAVVAVVSSPPATAEVERERVIVQVRDADPAAVAREVAGRHGGTVSHVYRHAISGFAMELPAPAVAALRSDPRVVRVEPDHPVRMFGEVPTGIERSAIDTNATADIDGAHEELDVGIAVLDTGIDDAHPDLNVVGGVDCSTDVTTATGECLEGMTPADDNGHGTHVAGTAAAIDDGAGVVGAAPGARLWSVKVLDDEGRGMLSWVIAGLDWVADNAEQEDIDVANTSFGCDPSESDDCSGAVVDEAVSAVVGAGVVVVAAAGNSRTNIEGWALTAHPDVITVSAMADFDGQPGGTGSSACGKDSDEEDDTFYSRSNFGDAVDLAAPGVCIVSTWPATVHPFTDYVYLDGTSMAAPHVAGAAGLYIVEETVTRDSSRAATVRNGLIDDWSVAQSSACGFTDGKTDEPMLYLSSCPKVAIEGPADGTRVTVGTSVTFSGVASDEDGDLTSEISWASDLDGALGRGGKISVELSEGSHAVTATVQADGVKATDTVTVHVDPEPSIGRLAGSDRIATAVEISQEAFADGAEVAVLAYAGGFPDALAATPLATALDGPVLLNARDHLHGDVAAEIRRLGASDVYVMGGTAVQTSQVEKDLSDRDLRAVRISGADRFATAAEAAEAAMQTWRSAGAQVSSDAVVALGTDFPDALSGGALAGTGRAPLLLTGRDHLPAATSDALRDLGVTGVALMGGTAAVSDAVASDLEQQDYDVRRIAGATRFHTAVAAAEVAVRAGASYRSVLIASGRSFPDALTGAPAVVSRGGVLLLSERDDLPDPSSDALRTADDVNWVRLAGGTVVLTDAVRDEAAAASGISP